MDQGRAKVLAAVDAQRSEQIGFLQELVRQPSTLGHEASAQELVTAKFRQLGLAVETFEPSLIEIAPLRGYSPVEWDYTGRYNVVGRRPSRGQTGRSLILNGHIDVVSPEPVHHWTRDPWGGAIEDGRLYGRGAADMKAGIAQMVYAVEAIRRAGVSLRGDVTLESVIEEECTGNGTLSCLARGIVADGAIITEPHALAAYLAQVGVLWLRIAVRGLGAHVLGAHRAVNAIEKAYVLIAALRELEAQFNREGHPAYAGVEHPINFNVGVIKGGDWPSTVPAECVLEARLAFFPGFKVEDVKARVTAHLREAAKADPWLAQHPPALTFYGFHAEGVILNRNDALIRQLAGAHEEVVGKELEYQVSTATTDIRHFNLYYGIPAICYGPAGDRIHGPDESVDLESLATATKVLALLVMDWCGVESQA